MAKKLKDKKIERISKIVKRQEKLERKVLKR